MTGEPVALAGLSAAMDGGLTAVVDVSWAMAATGMTGNHRLIGGVAVMGHIRRLGLASVDLLIPAYRSRVPDTVEFGSIVPSEVPGLAEAFKRPPVSMKIDLHLTDGAALSTTVTLPDAVGMPALKTLGRCGGSRTTATFSTTGLRR